MKKKKKNVNSLPITYLLQNKEIKLKREIFRVFFDSFFIENFHEKKMIQMIWIIYGLMSTKVSKVSSKQTVLSYYLLCNNMCFTRFYFFIAPKRFGS